MKEAALAPAAALTPITIQSVTVTVNSAGPAQWISPMSATISSLDHGDIGVQVTAWAINP